MIEIDREIAAYDRIRAELESGHMGEWALLFNEELIGIFPSFEAAAQQAVSRFGRGPYLIRQIGAPPVTIPASVVYHLRNA